MNLIDRISLNHLEREDANIDLVQLSCSECYDLAVRDVPSGEKSIVKCKKIVTINLELHIRNGCTLLIRNIKGRVTEQSFGEPLLGRYNLEDFGLNTSDILSAEADLFNGRNYMAALHRMEKQSEKVARTMRQGYIIESIELKTLMWMKKNIGWTWVKKTQLRNYK